MGKKLQQSNQQIPQLGRQRVANNDLDVTQLLCPNIVQPVLMDVAISTNVLVSFQIQTKLLNHVNL